MLDYGDAGTVAAVLGGVLAAGKAGAPPAERTRRAEALPEWVPATL